MIRIPNKFKVVCFMCDDVPEPAKFMEKSAINYHPIPGASLPSPGLLETEV